MNKLTVAVICGSQSPEHEVSVITARIVLEGIDREKYNPFPVYIAKDGRWFAKFDFEERLRDFKADKASLAGWTEVILPTNSTVKRFLANKEGSWEEVGPKIDVLFPTIHGPFGEDGTIQGIFEFADIPYVGSGVMASAVGMDKVILKDILKALGFPIPKYLWFLRNDWQKRKEELKLKIKNNLRYPVFVKPANGGSSIGVSKVNTEYGLDFAIELAGSFDRKVVVEEGLVDGIIEVNCAVLGNDDPIPSLCYQPVVAGEFQDYETKYLKGGGTIKSAAKEGKPSIKIPAPISLRLTKKLQETAIAIFKALDLAGTARIDFLVDPKRERFWVEEPNTLPGTISVGVWKASGVEPDELISRLIDLAIEHYQDKKRNIRTFDSP
ncbi:MAG: D-alanine--D-alanine ligase family protein, partial [Candidatus Paceibacteria bacterium]